jgi:hypothetical protein
VISHAVQSMLHLDQHHLNSAHFNSFLLLLSYHFISTAFLNFQIPRCIQPAHQAATERPLGFSRLLRVLDGTRPWRYRKEWDYWGINCTSSYGSISTLGVILTACSGHGCEHYTLKCVALSITGLRVLYALSLKSTSMPSFCASFR